MSKLDATDIQGFVLRGYNLPFARYMFLEIVDAQRGQAFIGRVLDQITTGEHWDAGKPEWTVNIAFTHKGLVNLDLPDASLLSFPVEFLQGMKARAKILSDTGKNAPERWDQVWREGRVDIWLAVNSTTKATLDTLCADLQRSMEETSGAKIIDSQDAGALCIDGKWSTKEHFGYTDGFGNPDFLGVERDTQPGQGKLMADGTWVPLATGELLLGYADEAGELPVAPIPHLLANNGTFMVFRKLHQNVATFRAYLDERAAIYGGGKEKLA